MPGAHSAQHPPGLVPPPPAPLGGFLFFQMQPLKPPRSSWTRRGAPKGRCPAAPCPTPHLFSAAEQLRLPRARWWGQDGSCLTIGRGERPEQPFPESKALVRAKIHRDTGCLASVPAEQGPGQLRISSPLRSDVCNPNENPKEAQTWPQQPRCRARDAASHARGPAAGSALLAHPRWEARFVFPALLQLGQGKAQA